MSKLDQLKSILNSRGLWAKKTLGQNFLIDEQSLDKIVETANLSKTDHVVEVGPGTGFLTEQLIQKASHVTAVELDADMVDILRKQFSMTDNLEVIHEDILKTQNSKLENSKLSSPSYQLPAHSYKVVANIPYYITSPLIKHFLMSDSRPSLMVLLVQKEVAEKICGRTGRSVITIETEVFGKPEYIATVPARSFYPSPKVDSAILKIAVYPKPLVPEKELDYFLRIVKFGFSQKRKKLANSLGAGLHKKPTEVREALILAKLSPDCRAEELSIEDWKKLTKLINKLK